MYRRLAYIDGIATIIKLDWLYSRNPIKGEHRYCCITKYNLVYRLCVLYLPWMRLPYGRPLQRSTRGRTHGCRYTRRFPMLYQRIQSCLLQCHFGFTGWIVIGPLEIVHSTTQHKSRNKHYIKMNIKLEWLVGCIEHIYYMKCM